MRLSNIPALFLIISLFCPLYSNQIKTIGLFERKIQHSVERRDSVRFISESFRKTCRGEGFANLEEWSRSCRGLWELEEIEFETVEENEAGREKLLRGSWAGPHGSGEVFYRIREN